LHPLKNDAFSRRTDIQGFRALDLPSPLVEATPAAGLPPGVSNPAETRLVPEPEPVRDVIKIDRVVPDNTLVRSLAAVPAWHAAAGLKEKHPGRLKDLAHRSPSRPFLKAISPRRR
jgi:hypothetical protein